VNDERIDERAAAGTGTPAVTVVLPTYNERDNLAEAIRRVGAALAGIEWEVIVVDDDSPDGTAELAHEIAARDHRVRCIHRIDRRGLAGACIEGMLSASAPFVAVMDADLQHDEALLPRMLEAVVSGAADIAVGSRFLAESSIGSFAAHRRAASGVANGLARALLGARLTDPMSGFFLLRRAAVERIAHRLAPQGFKILLDIIVSSRPRPTIVELPYVFRERVAGESKLDSAVMIEFLALLVSKMLGGFVGVRFVLFAFVGLSGVAVHLATLQALVLGGGVRFDLAQAAATLVAMTTNFVLNNQVTYRDRRLTGFAAVKGLLSFYLVCSLGAVANVGVASMVYGYDRISWIAGIAGIIIGSIWNYVASAALTWRVR
jgi:dolichol-phosphate mannosyltransferase